ncbi:uncharacterized protein C2845_PM01G32730 [Panicum miliaceum]|uniref:Uncharacterized protein n=1 Tax=Panicum miliaceum TaxID=4540 RepID=A0A3L6TJQ8_PANMI|nr:uncharacterized protein C2845_PM01G32730 [Panicum miliaceum]
MARWSASTAAVLSAGLLLCVMSLAASAQPLQLGNMQVITMNGKRNSKFTCADTRENSKRPGCTATCPNRCLKKCLVLCPTCKTFCLCDFYPGVSCGDPRFTGADGNNFPATLAALPHLGQLNLSQNRLAGEIALPGEFVSRLGRHLDVRGNDELCVDRGLQESGYLGAPRRRPVAGGGAKATEPSAC